MVGRGVSAHEAAPGPECSSETGEVGFGTAGCAAAANDPACDVSSEESENAIAAVSDPDLAADVAAAGGIERDSGARTPVVEGERAADDYYRGTFEI